MLGKFSKWAFAGLALLTIVSCKQRTNQQDTNEFTGSESCIECHEKFYKLWRPSFHGKAMMPADSKFIAEYGLPDSEPIAVEGKMYKIITRDSAMVLQEFVSNEIQQTYNVDWAMGGHNVFCFLTPLDKGKLQTIPLAYDMNGKTWFNYPESAVRHFMDEEREDEALPWKDAMYTFNTGCYSCHISQLSTNFDLSSETYHTTWREAGINCETCHGPAGEHIRIFKNLKEGEEPEDIGLIVTSTFTQEQHNASCAPCHAKMNPITPSYMPGDKFFDNYDIVTLEDHDFYPDGRDLGENYTMTGWMMNPCLEKSEIHCVTCHTSSGRDRNKANPNQACLQCHNNRSEDLEAHTGHEADSPGSVCINCHMPKREFVGRFLRSDHSFRPPMPEATIRFGSPNACNQCHSDKSPEWANAIVKKRKNGNYQEATLKWAQLVKEAQSNEWKNVQKMFAYIKSEEAGQVVTNSLIRLLLGYHEDDKEPVLQQALNSKWELVRSSAARALSGFDSETTKNALLKACQDEFRLVRIAAVATLLEFNPERFTAEQQTIIDKAEAEYVTSMTARPDNWSAHYNLGIYHQNKGNAPQALNAYETAARLYPESVMPLINSSVLYSYVGNQAKAEENLKKVLEFDADNEAANLNLGLLLAEQGRLQEAEKALKTALDANPEDQPVAAKNLSVIVGQRGDLAGAVKYAKMALLARPEDPGYAYTLAFYQVQNGQKQQAVKLLEKTIKKYPEYLTAVSFLADVYLKDGKKDKALKLYKDALKVEGLSAENKAGLQQAISSLQR